MSEEDKLKTDLIKQFNKEFSDSPISDIESSELGEVPGWVDTGNYALNWISSKDIHKGLPLGRVVILSGDPGTGKSMIALSMMRQPDIDLIVYLDSEGGGVTKDFASFLGIDTKKMLYAQIDTIEDLISRMRLIIDTIEKNKSDKKVLMVIDSISMLSTEKELDPNAGADMGMRAKLTRSFFKQYARKMQKLKVCCVLPAHLTMNIGGYGDPKVVSGGTILGYVPSIEVRFSKVNAESETDKSAIGTSMVKIRAEIKKSRFGTLGKRVSFDLDMKHGLDRYAGLFDILRDYGFVIPASANWDEQIKEKTIPKRSSGWWAFKPFDNEQTESLYNRMIKEGLTSSGKFREKQLKDFARENSWFLDEVQNILNSIYKDDKEEEEKEDKKEDAKLLVEEKKAKKKKKTSVEITEVA